MVSQTSAERSMLRETTSVTAETTDILIECAYFDPERIARCGQLLGVATDARSRFERGADPAFVETGLALATQMALALAGGEPSEIVRVGAPPLDTLTVDYEPRRAEEQTMPAGRLTALPRPGCRRRRRECSRS